MVAMHIIETLYNNYDILTRIRLFQSLNFEDVEFEERPILNSSKGGKENEKSSLNCIAFMHNIVASLCYFKRAKDL